MPHTTGVSEVIGSLGQAWMEPVMGGGCAPATEVNLANHFHLRNFVDLSFVNFSGCRHGCSVLKRPT